MSVLSCVCCQASVVSLGALLDLRSLFVANTIPASTISKFPCYLVAPGSSQAGLQTQLVRSVPTKSMPSFSLAVTIMTSLAVLGLLTSLTFPKILYVTIHIQWTFEASNVFFSLSYFVTSTFSNRGTPFLDSIRHFVLAIRTGLQTSQPCHPS